MNYQAELPKPNQAKKVKWFQQYKEKEPSEPLCMNLRVTSPDGSYHAIFRANSCKFEQRRANKYKHIKKKRKHITEGYSAAEQEPYCPLVVDGVITE